MLFLAITGKKNYIKVSVTVLPTTYQHLTHSIPTSYQHINDCQSSVSRLLVDSLAKTCWPTNDQQSIMYIWIQTLACVLIPVQFLEFFVVVDFFYQCQCVLLSVANKSYPEVKSWDDNLHNQILIFISFRQIWLQVPQECKLEGEGKPQTGFLNFFCLTFSVTDRELHISCISFRLLRRGQKNPNRR